jgi:hypothetical protein
LHAIGASAEPFVVVRHTLKREGRKMDDPSLVISAIAIVIVGVIALREFKRR